MLLASKRVLPKPIGYSRIEDIDQYKDLRQHGVFLTLYALRQDRFVWDDFMAQRLKDCTGWEQNEFTIKSINNDNGAKHHITHEDDLSHVVRYNNIVYELVFSSAFQFQDVADTYTCSYRIKRKDGKGHLHVQRTTSLLQAKLANDEVFQVDLWRVRNNEEDHDYVRVDLGPDPQRAEEVMDAFYRLNLEALGIKTDRGCLVIDGYGRTNVPGVYAIGDVAGPPMLAHKAEHEGVICVEKIAGVPGVHPMNKLMIPGCTYCHPQVASVGLTEAKAKEAGHDIRVGRFQFQANGKAIALGEDQGLIKTIFDKKSGQLIGAHMVGHEVTELIQGFVVAMNLETTEEELMHTIFPHPTLSEMMKESVLDAYGKVLNA